MTDFVALRSLVFAGECFFGASLILALAWILVRHGTAGQRHLVWLGAFMAMLVLPLAAGIVPPGFILHMPAAAPLPAAELTAADLAVMAAPSAPSFTVANVVTALAAVWLLGVLVIVLRMLVGQFGLAMLLRHSVPHIPNGIDGEKFRGTHWQLRLRTSPGDEGPITWGIFKSIVLLPKASVRWSRARLEAVLLHEFAHVHRRDSLARLIALVACAVYWPNPFVWSAAARMRRDAEIAADDAVLSAGVRASTYAEELVGLAREFGHEHPSFAGVTLSMAEPSGLKARIHSVLSSHQSRSGATIMDVLKIAAFGIAITTGLALARPCLAEASTTQVRPMENSAPEEQTAVTRIVHNDSDMRDEDRGPADQQVESSEPSDVAPPAPPAPVAPMAPTAPVAPAAPPAPAALPAPPAPPAHMTAEQRREFHRAMEEQRAEVRRAQVEIRRAAAEVRRAIADAHIDEQVAQALREAEPAMKQAREISQAEVRRAIAEAHIKERVAEAMEKARPDIEKAIAQAHRAAAEARRHAAEARKHATDDGDLDSDQDSDE